MKKEIYLSFIAILISLIIGIDNVKANGPVMWIECPVNKDNKGSGEDKTWIYFRNGSAEYGWYFYNGKEDKSRTNTFYTVDWCWMKNSNKLDDGWCDKVENYGEGGLNENFEKGYCPTNHRGSSEGENRVLAGITQSAEVVRLDEPQYIFTKDANGKVWMEYYDANGNFKLLMNGEDASDYAQKQYGNFVKYGESIFDKLSDSYLDKWEEDWHIFENFEMDLLQNPDIGKNYFILNQETSFILNTMSDAEIIFGKNSNREELKTKIDNWYNENIDKINAQKSKYNSFKKEYGQLINSCREFNDKMDNGKSYSTDFNSMFNNLDNALPEIKGLYNVTTDFKLCTTGGSAYAKNSLVNCLIQEELGNIDYAGKSYSLQIVTNDLIKLLDKDINEDVNPELNEDLTTLTKCISYLDENASDFGLDSKGTNDLREKYENYASEKDIYVIVGCKGLLGQDLINKIKSYLNIIKIVVPIILIGFGIFDFTKAVFASSEDDMKKAQQNFIKRLVIAILIFFVPVIVDLILNIANEVWGFISPNSCGIF